MLSAIKHVKSEADGQSEKEANVAQICSTQKSKKDDGDFLPSATEPDQVKVISGNIFPTLLNDQVDKYQDFMTDADVLVPETIINRPQRRLRAFE